MKGISPIVASVLLIAITMTIAGVLAYWSSTFVSNTLPGENTTTAQCRLAQFEFLLCNYNTTSQIMTFSVNNIRATTLNLTAFVQYTNGTISNPIPLNDSLAANTVKSYTLTAISSDFSNLLIKSNCPELSRSNSCTR